MCIKNYYLSIRNKWIFPIIIILFVTYLFIRFSSIYSIIFFIFIHSFYFISILILFILFIQIYFTKLMELNAKNKPNFNVSAKTNQLIDLKYC